MAGKLISFRHRVEGVPADATSVKLRDAAAAYGLRLAASPFTVIVAAGTDFDHDGTGLYSYTADGLTAGASYQYALEWVYGGETKRQVRTFTAASSAAVVGRYTTQAAVRTWLGTINADVLADLDGDGGPDVAAWTQVIADGEDELDHYAAGGAWDVPLAFTGGTAGQQAHAARVVERWARVLAGWALYARRPMAKETTATFDQYRQVVIRQVMRAKAGYRPLPGLATTGTAPGPQDVDPAYRRAVAAYGSCDVPGVLPRPVGWRGWYGPGGF